MVVALGIGMVAVLAAFQGTASSGFVIYYTAVNVKADVTMKFKVGSDAYSNPETISFTGEESGNSGNQVETKSFTEVTVDTMTKDRDLIIYYEIQNKGNKCSIDVDENFTAKGNLVVSYATSDSATTWESNLSDVVTESEINSETSISFYVKVSIADPTKDVVAIGAAFNVVLAVV